MRLATLLSLAHIRSYSLLQKPCRSLWKLDLCMTVLPQIEKLLTSKYER